MLSVKKILVALLVALPTLAETKVRNPVIQGAPVHVDAQGAQGDWNGTTGTDDTVAIQAALNTGKDVVCRSGANYRITNSLYMNTVGQFFSGNCTIVMDGGLAKPMLWLGATDASGSAPGSAVVNMKIRGVRFSCTGTKTLGSAGIAFQKATTTTLDSIYAWNCYAGIDVRGVSLVNTLVNPDLRQNIVGLNDRTDGTGTIDFQASRMFGGRCEGNGKECAVLGTADFSMSGTTIEGNGSVAQGGAGTESEIRLTQGYQSGKFTCVDCHFETTSSTTAVIQVDANACRSVELIGGMVVGGSAGTRYIIKTSSNCTIQGFTIVGGRYTTFKNYIQGSIANNSYATILPNFSDLSNLDVTTDLTLTAGASLFYMDRVQGLRIVGQGGVWLGSLLFSQLGSPANGKIQYCSDCTIANPCAGSGTGALAKRLNGVWVCN